MIERPRLVAAVITDVELSRAAFDPQLFGVAINGFDGIQHDIDSCPAVSLTPRERGVLEELQLGYSNKVIARNLGLSENTVKMHVQHLMRKLGARTRTEAVFIWRRAIAPSERPSGMLSQ